MSSIGNKVRFAVAGAALAVLCMAPAAEATFSGANGRIVYSHRGSILRATPDFDIWSANPDGSGATNLTPGNDTDDLAPAVSPDGKTIAFYSTREQEEGLFLMDADGSNVRPLFVSARSEERRVGKECRSRW